MIIAAIQGARQKLEVLSTQSSSICYKFQPENASVDFVFVPVSWKWDKITKFKREYTYLALGHVNGFKQRITERKTWKSWTRKKILTVCCLTVLLLSDLVLKKNDSIFCFSKLNNFLEKETGEDYIIEKKNSNQGFNQDFSE